MIRTVSALLLAALFIAGVTIPQAAQAQSRSASFLDPSAGGGENSKTKGSSNNNTLAADPPQTDAGETLVNVARRVTVFFFNGFRTPVTLSQLTVNADGNVRSKVLTDDCRTIKTLPAQDRCSIVMEIVPSSPGPWSVELLLNHTGQGRITRAEITGTTLGKTDEKSEGLAVSKKIAATLDFGLVQADSETSTRTMLIENDSPELLKIDSIDLIARDDQGLRLRSSGCKAGDQLKSGESCPITLMWEPRSRGNIVTDLIVRHSGSLGFVVVPIRGKADYSQDKDGGGGGGGGHSGGNDSADDSSRSSSFLPKSGREKTAALPGTSGTIVSNSSSSSSSQAASPQDASPPSIDEIARSLPAIRAPRPRKALPPPKPEPVTEYDLPEVNLIGTVNGRAILGDALDQTHVVGLGETVTIEDQPVELVQVDSTRAVVKIAGIRKELSLRQAASIVRASTTKKSATGSSSSAPGSTDTAPLPTVQAPATTPPPAAAAPAATPDPGAPPKT